ncbi:MAG: chloride channel protein, partial [Myxococcota bacterium]
FAVEAFAPVVVASVTGTVTGQLLLGDRLALQLPPMSLESPAELLVFPLLGVVCGAVTVITRQALRMSAEGLSRLPGPHALRPVVSGAVVGALAAAGLPHVMGNGYALMDDLVRGEVHLGLGLLGAVLVAKVVATALAYSGKSGGGIFAPSLFLGAVTGQWVGQVAAAVAPTLAPQPGVFAVVGMGAVSAALAHTPATMALMIAEMTGNYALVLPLLVTIAIATVIGNAVDPRSVYVQPLVDRGVPLEPGGEVRALDVGDVAIRDGFHTVPPTLGFDPLWRLLRDDPDVPVLVTATGAAPRWVELRDLQPWLDDPARRAGLTASDVAKVAPTVRPDEPLAAALESLVRTGGRGVAVVGADGNVVGILTERVLLGVLNRTRR